MIIVFKGHECDDEQVVMIREVKNLTKEMTDAINNEIDNIQNDEEWEDSDYEDIIDEAFNRLGIEASWPPSVTIQM